MSITYVKSKKLFDAYPEYAIDKLQATAKLAGVEYISFHNKSNFANIRVKIPAGTEICGVVLRKSTNPHQPTQLALNVTPDVVDELPPRDKKIFDWYSNFNFLKGEEAAYGACC